MSDTPKTMKTEKKVKKTPPPGGWPKRKKLTKAERRAKQEEQRRKKGLAPSGGTSGKQQSAKKGGNATSSDSSATFSKNDGRFSFTNERGGDGSTTTSGSSAFKTISSLFAHLKPYKSANSASLGLTFGRGEDIAARSSSFASASAALSSSSSSSAVLSPGVIHPNILRCGLRMIQQDEEDRMGKRGKGGSTSSFSSSFSRINKGGGGSISDSNRRCEEMLEALKRFFQDLEISEESDALTLREKVWQTFDRRLKVQVSFLADCRPLSFSMRNAISCLRNFLPTCGINNNNTTTNNSSSSSSSSRRRSSSATSSSAIALKPSSTSSSDSVALARTKRTITKWIDRFLKENVRAAGIEIAFLALRNIVDGDVVATYGYDSTVERVLIKASQEDGRKFRVVVVDDRERRKDGGGGGKRMLKSLASCNIDCTFVRLNAISYLMQDDVTKVLLGAEAMLSNGVAVSAIGSATVAMVAKACKRPVLVCCESYKFCQRVQIDSIVWNELGDPSALRLQGGGAGEDDGMGESGSDFGAKGREPHFLNPLFDTIPVEFITMVVTEAGMIPSTSVPVVIRERDAAILLEGKRRQEEGSRGD
eukprot:g5472.t1